MARSRNIKPGFFKNEELVSLGFPAMICFAGLWTIADKAGRLEDRPKRIKAEIFPYSSVNVERILQALNGSGFINRYQVEGTNYIAIPGWKRHQNPHVREPESSIPASARALPKAVPSNMPEHLTSTCLARAEHMPGPADSGFLIPDSGFPQPGAPGQARSEHVLTIAGKSPADWVERWYSRHPKKKNKVLVEQCVLSLAQRPDAAELFAEIDAAHTALCETEDWTKSNGRYAPKLDEWLEDEGWKQYRPAHDTGWSDLPVYHPPERPID